MSELWRRLRVLFRRERFDHDLEEEMQAHLETQAEENEANGMPAEEARYAAKRQFGNATLLKEKSREMWGWGSVERLAQDLKFALRMLRKNPGFSAIAALTLALGIGANTAIFSVLYAVLLRPLPYPEPDRIIAVWETYPYPGGRGQGPPCFPRFQAWHQQNEVFDGLAMYQGQVLTVGLGDTPDRIDGAIATADFFRVLRAEPLLGRTFLPGDDQPGKERVAVLSYQFWQRRFGADPAMVGKTIPLNGQDYPVVGIMPPSFRFPPLGRSDVIIPLVVQKQRGPHAGHNYPAIARLKPGITLDQARAEMEALTRHLEQGLDEASARGVLLRTLLDDYVRYFRPVLWVLSGAVGFVLLIACANITSLLLARGAARRAEIAIRAAIGASRARLVRQFLTESLLLAGFGVMLGLALSAWLLHLLKLAPVSLPRLNEASVNGIVLAFALAASVISAVAFGLLPAIQATRGDLQQPLKESARTLSGGSGWKRALIAGEVSLTVVLLIGAALLCRTLLLMIETEPGFRPDHLLTMRIALPTSKYQGKAAQAFYSRLLEQVSPLPGVRVAGLISRLPPDDYGTNGNFVIHGRPPVRDADAPFAEFRIVSPNYFSAMGIPLLRGRFLTAQDGSGAPCVLLINQALARAYWPNGDALGSRIEMGEFCTIVGIVQDVKNAGLQRKPEPEMYMSYLQEYPNWLARMSLVARTNLDPRQLIAAVRAEVSHIDPAQRVTNVQTMEERLSDVVSQPRFRAVLIGSFAALALLLALIGLYGVIGYEVTRRTHEIGVRMALGAGRQEVVRMVMGQGLRLVVTGVAFGIAGALALTQVLSGFLYRVSPRDPGSFVVVSALVIAIALVATYIPARRASRVHPMEALRYE